MNNVAIKRYMSKALKNCPSAFKKKLKADLYTALYDYVEEHHETDEGELVFCFGEPGHFCADYIASLDDNERLRLLSRNNFIKKAITIGVAAILVIASIGVFTIIYDVVNSDNYYYFVAMIGD